MPNFLVFFFLQDVWTELGRPCGIHQKQVLLRQEYFFLIIVYLVRDILLSHTPCFFFCLFDMKYNDEIIFSAQRQSSVACFRRKFIFYSKT